MVERNEVRIAGRDVRIYLGECLFLFQKFDQILLSASEKHIETMKYILHIFSAFGVRAEDDYIGEKGQYVYKTEETYIPNEKTGRKELRIFHKLGLTKHEDTFMFTKLKKPLELKDIK